MRAARDRALRHDTARAGLHHRAGPNHNLLRQKGTRLSIKCEGRRRRVVMKRRLPVILALVPLMVAGLRCVYAPPDGKMIRGAQRRTLTRERLCGYPSQGELDQCWFDRG